MTDHRVCKGAIALGSGCMRCARCADQLAARVKELEAAALAAPQASTTGVLYEHNDGRYAVSTGAPAAFSAGDPAWHRVGSVDLSALAAPPVEQAAHPTEVVPAADARDDELLDDATSPGNGNKAKRRAALIAAPPSPTEQPATQAGEVAEIEYGATEFGRIVWPEAVDSEKRLMALIVRLFGYEHQAFNDLETLVNRARHPLAHPAEQPACVAVLRYERGTPGRENEMPCVISCNWLPDGEYPVVLAAPSYPAANPAARPDLVEAVAKAILFEDCGSTADWQENTNLAEAAIKACDLGADEWRELFRLREAVKGPDGYATWQQAATSERVRRVKAERELAAHRTEQPNEDTAALDWLEKMAVTVRIPLRYGSRELFWASPDEDGAPSDIRTQIKAAQAKGGAA
jgi:hypothetical protein